MEGGGCTRDMKERERRRQASKQKRREKRKANQRCVHIQEILAAERKVLIAREYFEGRERGSSWETFPKSIYLGVNICRFASVTRFGSSPRHWATSTYCSSCPGLWWLAERDTCAKYSAVSPAENTEVCPTFHSKHLRRDTKTGCFAGWPGTMNGRECFGRGGRRRKMWKNRNRQRKRTTTATRTQRRRPRLGGQTTATTILLLLLHLEPLNCSSLYDNTHMLNCNNLAWLHILSVWGKHFRNDYWIPMIYLPA